MNHRLSIDHNHHRSYDDQPISYPLVMTFTVRHGNVITSSGHPLGFLADLGAPTPAIGGQAISRAGRPSRTAELSEAKIAQEMSSAGMISNADPMMVPPLSNA